MVVNARNPRNQEVLVGKPVVQSHPSLHCLFEPGFVVFEALRERARTLWKTMLQTCCLRGPALLSFATSCFLKKSAACLGTQSSAFPGRSFSLRTPQRHGRQAHRCWLATRGKAQTPAFSAPLCLCLLI